MSAQETDQDLATRKPRVAVVFGGRSGEHSISCVTAGSVLRAIDHERYDVVPVGITRDGRWVLESDEPERLSITSADKLPEVDASRETLSLHGEEHSSELVVHSPGAVPRTLGEVDVVFPLLHGPWGEDGTIQGLLEMAGVRYVGAGVLASAVGMDKHYMKVVFMGHGLPVGPYVVIKPRDWEQAQSEVVERVQAELEFPVFVKPARAGSSLGVSRVEDLTGLADAIEEARVRDPKVSVEQAIEGREIECAVLGGRNGGPPRASVPGEIVVDHDAARFYDFEEKYSADSPARTQAPADLPDDVAERVRELAVQAFEAVGAEGISRVDVFYTSDGDVV